MILLNYLAKLPSKKIANPANAGTTKKNARVFQTLVFFIKTKENVMSDVIEDIFYGNFNVSEMEVPNTPEYRNALTKNKQILNEVKNIMEKHDIDNAEELINDVFNSVIDLDNCIAIEIFKTGIKLGLAIGELKSASLLGKIAK